MKLELDGRDLYFDGQSSWDEKALIALSMKGIILPKTFVKEKGLGVRVKNKCNDLPQIEWNIPQKYKDIDLEELFLILAEDRGQAAINRTKYELELYKSRGLEDVLRLMCFIRDEFINNDVVWGVGRGSSVSSYLLYLLEIHLVDPIEYDLDIHEFIRT